MYRRFSFEAETDRTLECVPLAVRRKLDLAALKISLAGWQSLSRAAKLSLCHLPVEGEGDLEVYREVLTALAADVGATLKPLPAVTPDLWGPNEIPARVAERAQTLGVELTEGTWRALDEETRYCMWKYATTKDDVAKVRRLFDEALVPGAAAASHHSGA